MFVNKFKKLSGALLILTVFQLLIPTSGNTALAKEPVPDTGDASPTHCVVKYYSFKTGDVTEDDVKQIVEFDYSGVCTDANTIYVNRNIEDLDEAWMYESCAAAIEIVGPKSGNIAEMLATLITNFAITFFGAVDYSTWDNKLGGYSVVLYYEPETHVYDKVKQSFVTEEISANDPAVNPSAGSDQCIQKDNNATLKNGYPCNYLRCVKGGHWGAPLTEDFNASCNLNPMFRFATGDGAEIEEEGTDTALGCFPSTPQGIVTAILRIFMGIAGLLALVVIIVAIITLMTQSDNPEKVKEAYSRITFAVIGLLVIIFSVFILRFFGVHILNLPQYGTTIVESFG